MLGSLWSRGISARIRAAEHETRDAVAYRSSRDGCVPGEQAERASIVRQHVGAEPMDASPLAGSKNLFEEQRAEADSLPAVSHDQPDVSGPVVGRAVPRDPHQLGTVSVADLSDD